jgi:hypothetical protein
MSTVTREDGPLPLLYIAGDVRLVQESRSGAAWAVEIQIDTEARAPALLVDEYAWPWGGQTARLRVLYPEGVGLESVAKCPEAFALQQPHVRARTLAEALARLCGVSVWLQDARGHYTLLKSFRPEGWAPCRERLWRELLGKLAERTGLTVEFLCDVWEGRRRPGRHAGVLLEALKQQRARVEQERDALRRAREARRAAASDQGLQSVSTDGRIVEMTLSGEQTPTRPEASPQ